MGKIANEFKQSTAASGCMPPTAWPGLALSSAVASFLPGERGMIWYVNSATGGDAQDGKSVSTAFKTLGHALNAAKAGDTILIAPGAYDQNLASQVSAARGANIAVAVLGGG